MGSKNNDRTEVAQQAEAFRREAEKRPYGRSANSYCARRAS